MKINPLIVWLMKYRLEPIDKLYKICPFCVSKNGLKKELKYVRENYKELKKELK